MLRYIGMILLGLVVGFSLFVQYYAQTIFIAIFAGLWMTAAIIILCTVYIILELRQHRSLK